MSYKYRFVIAACARWETRYIAEWLSYHRAIGFEHIYLYCNDDDPRELYEAVLPFVQGPTPFVTFRFYPVQGEHRKMMLHFLDANCDDSEWICFLDIDEFIRLPSGQGIAQFIAPFEPIADCVMFNWVFFGPNGHKTPPSQNVLTTYTRRESVLHPFTKYVARSSIFHDKKLFLNALDNSFVHRLSEYLGTKIRAVNVLAEDMNDYYTGFPDASSSFIRHPSRHDRIFATALIHHYAFRSEQAFMDRVARGLKGDYAGEKLWGDLAQNETDFRGFINAINAVEDTSLAAFWDQLIAQAEQTNVLPDPRGRLLSRHKRALQSSICGWSRHPSPAEDAAGALNGRIDGTAKFHTGLEENPWWQVDLGGLAIIREIRIYNVTGETAARFKHFCLAVSIDGDTWVPLIEKRDDTETARPFIWNGPGTAFAQFVRVTLLGRDFLHLDQVEVFGELTGPGLAPK